MTYAYATDENGTILAVYKGDNPPEGYQGGFTEPLDKDAKIVDGMVMLPKQKEPEPATEPEPVQPATTEINFTAATV